MISAEKKVTKTSGNLRIVFNSSGIDLPLEQFLYDVQIWKVIYETSYKGEKIMASGMAYIPVMDSIKSSYHVFAHGTITANRDAPSELPLNDFQNLLFAGMASTGLITVVPDFIGFGSSRDIMHPYYVEEMSALAVIDELRAVRELLNQEGISSDGELYLSGYSQGGYVAMATHKYIEEHDIEYFNLKASFPSSGGYDMKGVRDFFFDQEIYQHVLETSKSWKNAENLMYVVGATKASYFKEIRKIIPTSFLLVPGVGAQGGNLQDVCRYGLSENIGLLINSSRGIIYAANDESFATAAAEKAKELQLQMAAILDANAI